LVLPLALAACGGGSASGPKKIDPIAYVKHSATKTADLKSEHMVMTGKLDASGQSISLDGSGDFANKPLKGTFAVSFSGMGQSLAMNEIMDGTTLYLKSPAFAGKLPAGKTWAKADLASLGKASGLNYSALASQSPAQALARIEAAGSVTQVGSDTIDGVQTTHFRITNLDFSKLAPGAKLPSGSSIKYGPIDVWVGNDTGYVYRELMSFDFSESGQTGTMKMQTDFSKFGEPVNVTLPTAKETVDMTKLLKERMHQ
jgi:hypothetical protein